MKKIITSIACLLAVILFLTNVQAETTNGTNKIYQGKINIGVFDNEFKASLSKVEKVLPFVNVATKNMIYDSDVLSSGISFGNESINVKKNLKGVHVLMGADTITVDGSIEYALIIAPNVVINGNIQKDVLVIAESVFITDKAVIGNDATLVCTKAEVKGKIEGNLIGTTENLYLSGTIAKDIRMSSKVFKSEKETVKGDIYIETDSDMKYIKDKYPNSQIMPFTTKNTVNKDSKVNVTSYIIKGLILVIVYTLIAFFITKKENNIVDKMAEKFKANVPYTIIFGMGLLFIMPALLLGLLILGIVGLGIIAWPILVAYISFIIIACIIDILVVGITLANLIIRKINKDKITKTKKIAIYAGMFAVIYVLTSMVGYISLMAMMLSIGILFTFMTKKVKKAETK